MSSNVRGTRNCLKEQTNQHVGWTTYNECSDQECSRPRACKQSRKSIADGYLLLLLLLYA